MSLFSDDDTFDQPLDPRIVDPGGTPLPPPVRHASTPNPAEPAQMPVGGVPRPANHRRCRWFPRPETQHTRP